MYIYAKVGNQTYRMNTSVNGWVNWSNPEIKDILITEGTVTVGTVIKADGGAWGTLDDFNLNYTREYKEEQPTNSNTTPPADNSVGDDGQPGNDNSTGNENPVENDNTSGNNNGTEDTASDNNVPNVNDNETGNDITVANDNTTGNNSNKINENRNNKYNELPITATNYTNIFFIGIVFIILGTSMFGCLRRQQNN
jgi:arabinogalactan endo-1,4-beta-galactosidase